MLVTYTEEREACEERSPVRNAYFGDLHIHTAFSYDARPYGTQVTPAEAYRFAQGEPIGAPPYDAHGAPTVHLRLDRPLDFAAVTDHSEFFGEMKLCFEPSSAVYDEPACRLLREGGGEGTFPLIRVLLAKDPERIGALCGPSGAGCTDAAVSVWQITQDMAEAAYDRTAACRFTTFVGYEHTGTPDSNNYHRNVLFRNAKVPARAISYIETPSDHELWGQLTAQCLEGIVGCDVLAIPHNSNLSAGSMFPSYIARYESPEAGRAMAQLRNSMEPVMEIFQHKGSSECFNGFPDILGVPDELCGMEQFRSVGERQDALGKTINVGFCEEGEVGRRGFLGHGCISKNDFYRTVLLTGLRDEAVIGVNSYKLGVIASTDTHLGLAGHADEDHWHGHLVIETETESRLRDRRGSPLGITVNPGGLAGVWAVENSRDAIFEALRRREVFGTTGTRIEPRFFGGWRYTAGDCRTPDLAARGYARGTPMGGDLGAPRAGVRPTFLAAAVRDPNAAQLQKLQVIKGWVDAEGQAHYEVFDVAGQEYEAGEVDLATGVWSGRGSDALCAIFEDAAFDPEQTAYYYLRVVEVPTLRWSWRQCLQIPADERPAECESAPKTIQELAWTPPIWYAPRGRHGNGAARREEGASIGKGSLPSR